MSTTNELPPQNTEQKLDTIIDLVISFRAAIIERMDKLEEDSRARYVDLRQRIEKQEERLTSMEERQVKMEGVQAEMRQDISFLVKHFHTMDRKLDVFVNEFSLWKERVRQLEDTRELRH